MDAANYDAAQKRSPLAGIPKGLPALAQAEAYLDRMSRLRSVTTPDAPWTALADLHVDAALTPELVGEVLFALVAWDVCVWRRGGECAAGNQRLLCGARLRRRNGIDYVIRDA